jgi:hypothetical protein
MCSSSTSSTMPNSREGASIPVSHSCVCVVCAPTFSPPPPPLGVYVCLFSCFLVFFLFFIVRFIFLTTRVHTIKKIQSSKVKVGKSTADDQDMSV